MSSADCDADFVTFVQTAIGYTVYREGGVPQDTREPYATWERIDTMPVRVFDKVTRLAHAVYRVTLFSVNPVTVKTMQDALWTALDRYSGLMGTTKVQVAFVNSISTQLLQPTDGGQPRVHIREFDVDLHFERSAIQR